jgi:hypothetical protein
LRVGEERISSIDDDIAFFQQWRELTYNGVNRRARFDHDHGFARFSEHRDEFFHCSRRLNVFSFGPAAAEFLSDFNGAVENGDRKAPRFHVQSEIFAHHSQTDQANITLIRSHFSIFW